MKITHSLKTMLLSFFLILLAIFFYSTPTTTPVYVFVFAFAGIALFIIGFVLSFFERPKNSDKKEEASTEKEVPKKENETGK